MTLPSLSIVIPCYNGIPYVLCCLDSVVQQKEHIKEIIVVDDGSTDNSAEAVISKYGNAVKVLRKENQGAASARNFGLEHATGELIIWLDADDDIAPDTINSRRRAFIDDPQLEMLVGRNKIINVDTGEVVAISPCSPSKKHYLTTDLVCRRNLPHLNVMTFRRSSLSKVGIFDVNLHNGQDHDFWFRCWATLNWSFVDQVQAIQRDGSFESLSRSKGKIGFNRNIGKMLRKNRSLFRRITGSNQIWNHGYSVFCADMAMHHYHRDLKLGALLWAAKSLWHSPIKRDKRALPMVLENTLPRRAYHALRGLVRSQPE